MPELPEVETTRRGIAPALEQQKITAVIVRNKKLRWIVPIEISRDLAGQTVQKVQRRGKYLLLACDTGTVIIHLGMSGSLRILSVAIAANKHDHVDLIFGKQCLRFNDPRRFGCVLWTQKDALLHPLLKNLGPEPLSTAFSGSYLFRCANKRHVPIKNFLMDSSIVVGVGNIYANEALFIAGIHPQQAAGSISLAQFQCLAKTIKEVLRAAIKQGGTTLRNFSNSDGKPGYFKQKLNVYGRGGLACLTCKTILEEIRLGQRSTVYCPQCQILTL